MSATGCEVDLRASVRDCGVCRHDCTALPHVAGSGGSVAHADDHVDVFLDTFQMDHHIALAQTPTTNLGRARDGGSLWHSGPDPSAHSTLADRRCPIMRAVHL